MGKPVILCFRCGRQAAQFIETRINEGKTKRFTFFHVDANGPTECTVDIDRAQPLKTPSDNSWESEIHIDEKDLALPTSGRVDSSDGEEES